MWELYMQVQPYSWAKNRHDVIRFVAQENRRLDFTSQAPVEYRKLAQRCWDAQPDRRPTFTSIVETINKLQAQCREEQAATSVL
mmetsp:Transcript_576/g.684  ORF Transcript_576/g.684 Transcript_576/m.684 type:complete len:84 (-) Transcript_576:173-424(-)